MRGGSTKKEKRERREPKYPSILRAKNAPRRNNHPPKKMKARGGGREDSKPKEAERKQNLQALGPSELGRGEKS